MLSDDEFDALCDCLDARADLDYGELLGLLHAVALAPSLMPPSVWFGAVFPDGFGDLDQQQASQAMNLVMRQYDEVMSAIADGEAIIPDAGDVQACKSFAFGYTMGAALDDEWIDDDARWSFAAPFAFLAGHFELVPEPMLEKLRAQPEMEEHLRSEIGALLEATNETFKPARLAQFQTFGERPNRGPPRVGRNDPCPCGSGKKYKRCCGKPGART